MAKRYDVSITWLPGHWYIPGNCRSNELTRMGMSIELSDEFLTLGIPLGICGFITDNLIADLVNSGLVASEKGRTAQKIWSRLDRRRTATLLKLKEAGSALLSGLLRGIVSQERM